ncbi:MAG: putative 2OG-Fe(II) oxygenase [Allosphingosinicella sp.]
MTAIRWATPRSPKHRLAALALARSAVAAAPDKPSPQLALGRALSGAGELEEAASLLDRACRRFPETEALHEELANALARLGEVEAALACARGREAAWAPVFAFTLLARQGRRSETVSLEPAVAAVRPADSNLLESRAKRARGDPGALLRLCEDVLSHDPAAAHALHYKALALAQLGRRDEAAELMGLDRFLSIAPLPAPPGFGGEEAFRDAVREEIMGNSSLHPDPVGHATRSGLRTRDFPVAGDRAATALMETIRTAVAAYADALDGDHPFVRGRPNRATFNPWALLFRGSGHQVAHHHPGCWLTGVYYVSARREPSGPGPAYPGAIRIGILPDWTGIEPPWPVTEVEPVPGTLLLFPSFVPHETVPPGEGAERISIAFDVSAAP